MDMIKNSVNHDIHQIQSVVYFSVRLKVTISLKGSLVLGSRMQELYSTHIPIC